MVFHVAKQLLNCMYTPTSYGDIRNTSSNAYSNNSLKNFQNTAKSEHYIDYIQAIMKTAVVIMLLAVAVACCYAADDMDQLDLPGYPGQ